MKLGLKSKKVADVEIIMIACCLLIGQVTADRRVMEKISTADTGYVLI